MLGTQECSNELRVVPRHKAARLEHHPPAIELSEVDTAPPYQGVVDSMWALSTEAFSHRQAVNDKVFFSDFRNVDRVTFPDLAQGYPIL